ncbi:hypothetical protein GGS23DRAFT_607285 [Durotheca rogersii]|uniref:uncharacterized protein n=1 Tax=Durotheca rogersii TaxID=419775 RepID=UPI00222002FB|nr:uncharacterized protein GGS23DRAFT_607285 [Durotheca rogersii]KAI5859862.1 hypothetical protein GGS23DRAFT_607285 [Durotheca rogersii]
MADDQGLTKPDIPDYPFAAPSKRSSLPRPTMDTKHFEPTVVYGAGNLKRVQRQPPNLINEPGSMSGHGELATLAPKSGEEPGEAHPVGAGVTSQERGRDHIAPGNSPLPHSIIPPDAPIGAASVAASSRGSSISSGSIATVTEMPFARKDTAGKFNARQRKFLAKRPNAFNFLDSDSPDVTPESIIQSMEEATRRSPTSSMQGQSPSSRSTSTISSNFKDDASETTAGHETDRSTSPDRSVEDGDESHSPISVGARIKTSQDRMRSYEVPRISRGNPQPSPIMPTDFPPLTPSQGTSQHTPRPERLPLSGYELLASKLSTSSSSRAGARLRPIYRRFETLNHRVLLHLQDEICELEEQLRRIDTADTQNRRLPGCVYPASRRAEHISGSELHWHRTDILGKIGFKLEQYNRVLSSFRETLAMPTPALADMHDYRSYLATQAPIVEPEAHFLDNIDDLICVSYESQGDSTDEEAVPTPLPHSDFDMPMPPSPLLSKSRPGSAYRQEESVAETVNSVNDVPPIIPLSVAVTVAVILPILTFLIIPGYMGRLTVIFLVGLGALGALIQGGLVGVHANRELFVCVGLYGAVMSVIAGIVA